jgi:EAL domain-containing protein (putative c-di-GMP-specific phosphodiesterase class I)/GGDEF domain-containing protein
MTDEIRNLSNDALFQLSLGHAILAGQHSTRQVGLMFINFDYIDGLGKVSQNFSEQIWTLLRNTLRDSDTVVRMDSGEIGVLLPAVNGPEDVVLVAKKILAKFEDSFQSENLKFGMRPTIGIALYPENSSDPTTLVQHARLALSTAKRTKKNYILYSQDQTHFQRAPLRMSQLRQAIVADELFLLYQPKVCLRYGSASSVEVLTRWQHSEFGLILPDEFIPVAERTGLIIPLTLWVLHKSLLECRQWNQTGINVGVAVNLSMWNLDAQELPDQIEGLLKSVGLSADKLELEITESAIMGDPQRAIRNLTLIRDLGVRLTIDDFGTGYSSLAYLTKLPVTAMKIDKSFVQNMEIDRDNAVIVRSIIDLGHNLGLKVVAEGVETQEAVEMLQGFECDEAQGYFYSPPIPGSEVTEFSKNPRNMIAERSSLTKHSSKSKIERAPRINGTPMIPKSQKYPPVESTNIILEDSSDFVLKQR